MTDPKTGYFEIVSNYFQLNLKVDYKFQHRYRSKDISFLFKKELLMGLIIVYIF